MKTAREKGRFPMIGLRKIAYLMCLVGAAGAVIAQTPPAVQSTPPTAQAQPSPATRPQRPTPPTRDPNTPGYVTAKELPDGANAPANVDGNFVLGPTHNPAPEMAVREGVPQGTAVEFTMSSVDSKIYPGIA